MLYAERCRRRAQKKKIKLDKQLNRRSLREAIKSIKLAARTGGTWVIWIGITSRSREYVKKVLENKGFNVKDENTECLSIDWSGR